MFRSRDRAKRLFCLGALILEILVLGRFPASGAAPEENFHRFCAQCHGLQGRGDGVNASHMEIAPGNLTDTRQIARRTDDQIAQIIAEGGTRNGLSPLMPPWGETLTRKEIDDLVAYIRSLCQCRFEP